jgi:hypothetical protein
LYLVPPPLSMYFGEHNSCDHPILFCRSWNSWLYCNSLLMKNTAIFSLVNFVAVKYHLCV